MERSKFAIYSKTPCLIFCDKAFVGEVDENSCAKLEMFDNESKRIEIYPKSTKDLIYFIPFSIVISQQDNFSPNYQQFDLLDGNYEIMLNPRLELHFPMSFDKIFEEEKKGTRICVLSSSLTKITLENKKNKVNFVPKHILKDIVCKTQNCGADYFILTAKTENNQQYLFISNLEQIDECMQKVCDDITFDLPKFSTVSLCHDFYEHALIEKFELGQTGAVKLESFSSRKEQKSFSTPARKDVAKIFFECIKMRDYDLARVFMTKQLSEMLSDQHLKHFFPKFSQIKLSPDRDVVLLVGEELTYFQLSFVEGKIDNIEIFER